MRVNYEPIVLDKVLWRGPRQILLSYKLRSCSEETVFPPGTFVLFWYPGLEAIPLTPLQQQCNLLFYVAVRGATTGALHTTPPRNAGVIGPLGKEYRVAHAKKVLAVAGGAGIAALASIINDLAGRKVDVTLVYGARSAREIPPLETLVSGARRIVYATEDGTVGLKGTAVDALSKLNTNTYDLVLAAGPHPMICSLLKSYGWLGRKLIIALETYVRCGLGFCGKCIVKGLRKRLCVDGMFYTAEELLRGWFWEECKQTSRYAEH